MEQKQISISELSIEELQSLVQEKEERKLQLESLLKQGDYKNLKNGEAVRAGVELPKEETENPEEGESTGEVPTPENPETENEG